MHNMHASIDLSIHITLYSILPYIIVPSYRWHNPLQRSAVVSKVLKYSVTDEIV